VLAEQLRRSAASREIIDVLSLIPQVHDRGILDAAISHMQNMPPDDLSERLQSAYETARVREMALAKQQELQQVARKTSS